MAKDHPPLPGVREPGEPYRLHERTVAFAGKIFQVLRKRMLLPNGREALHEVVTHPGAVTVIPPNQTAATTPARRMASGFSGNTTQA